MSDANTPHSDAIGATPPRWSRGKKILLVVTVVVVGFLFVVLVIWGLAGAVGRALKQNEIDKGVSQIKQQTDLPKQVDGVTTWMDVKAEDGAVHYEYTVASNVDPSSLTEKSIRNAILPNLCSTASTRRILDDDITMRFSYVLLGSSKKIEITLTKADC